MLTDKIKTFFIIKQLTKEVSMAGVDNGSDEPVIRPQGDPEVPEDVEPK